MQIVAVTGGTGFVGEYLLPELLKNQDVRVRCLTRRGPGEHSFRHPALEYIVCKDDPEEISDALCGCDSLIHMAGCVLSVGGVDAAMSPEYLADISSAKTIFDACVKHNLCNIVFASTISVYGNGDGAPFTETQRCDPLDMYSVAKLAVEKMARCYHDRYGLNVKSLRIAQVFGAREKIKRPLLKMMCENCLNHQPVTVFGRGETSHDFVYVRDVCRGILLALEHPELHGEYNIGCGRSVSIAELAEAFCQGFRNPAGVVYLTDREEAMFHRALDIEKARRELGYVPAYTPLEACREMYALYQQKNVH